MSGNTVKAYARIVSFPNQATSGTCTLTVEMAEPPGKAFTVTGSGFAPSAALEIIDRSEDESIPRKDVAAKDGTFSATLLPAVAGKDSGTAGFTARTSTCTVAVTYEWGRSAFEWR